MNSLSLQIGSYSLATLAHMKHKPVYVLVESYKFLRTIPLNNASLPKSYLVIFKKADFYSNNSCMRYVFSDFHL